MDGKSPDHGNSTANTREISRLDKRVDILLSKEEVIIIIIIIIVIVTSIAIVGSQPLDWC
jgi:cell division protein FtsL